MNADFYEYIKCNDISTFVGQEATLARSLFAHGLNSDASAVFRDKNLRVMNRVEQLLKENSIEYTRVSKPITNPYGKDQRKRKVKIMCETYEYITVPIKTFTESSFDGVKIENRMLYINTFTNKVSKRNPIIHAVLSCKDYRGSAYRYAAIADPSHVENKKCHAVDSRLLNGDAPYIFRESEQNVINVDAIVEAISGYIELYKTNYDNAIKRHKIGGMVINSIKSRILTALSKYHRVSSEDSYGILNTSFMFCAGQPEGHPETYELKVQRSDDFSGSRFVLAAAGFGNQLFDVDINIHKLNKNFDAIMADILLMVDTRTAMKNYNN